MPKSALITGGSSGLGFEMAKNLAEKGYSIIILARDQEKIDRTTEELRSEGHEATGYSCDITDESRLREVCSETAERFGGIDFLILNAGVVTCKLLSDYSDTTDMKHDLDIDLWGTILCSHIFQPILRTGAKVLMISSGFGLMGPAGYTIYAAAKAGMINFAESLRRELLRKNIAVYITCPGDMDTPQFHEEHRTMPDWMKGEAPRGMMHPREAAEKILKKCTGKRFMIIINSEITGLIMLTKLLPRQVRDAIIDRMFPLPDK
ncbi:SDR family NAD(P)-dependent oxidoreductase [Candidatus Latescibacterota bacterium]